MSFSELGLNASLVAAVEKKGYTTPSPIQEKAIPVILERKDVMASAQTGTGKTAGFVLPILQILASNPTNQRRRSIRTLILTPTRELAAQIQENVVAYSQNVDLKSTVIFGGVNANPQIATLRNGVDILIATPGRLLDLYTQKAVSLSQVEILVLDEADRMLDMGFIRDIKRVLAILPAVRQNLLFSATFSYDIKKFAASILRNPEMVEATPENTTAELVNQRFVRTDKAIKQNLVIDLIEDGQWKQVLIFTRTKHGANKLSEKLNKCGISAAAIHGNKTQAARTKALDNFKKNEVRVLVATDIAARGLDIPLLPHVINFELPNVPEDYVHRIGRTGRAGASGEALSIVSEDEVEFVEGIEKLLGYRFEMETIPGYEATRPPEKADLTPRRAKEAQQRRQQRPSSNNNSGNAQQKFNKNKKPGFKR